MTGCFTWLLLLVLGVLTMVSLLKWFEQTTEAVDNRWWSKLILLLVAPPVVWLFPSRVSAGRPSAFPRHEPVRGFGSVPLEPRSDQPPPGTPKEFIGPPKIPPKKPAGAKPAVDPDKLAKLKQKMKEQGML